MEFAVTTVIPNPSDVDALDVDAPAAAQLAKDAPRAHVARTDGCTYIRFDSRDDFRAACEEGVIQLGNPFDIQVRGADVIAPVLFGKDGQWRWQAEARYPAQRACDCAAEVTHQLGCSATEYPEQWMFAEPAQDACVVPWYGQPCAGKPVVDGRCPTHKGICVCPEHPDRVHLADCPATWWRDELWANDIEVVVVEVPSLAQQAREHAERRTGLPRRVPGATTDVHYTNLGLRGAPACGATQPTVLATVVAANVTCPDCTALLPAPVEPLARFLRDAYSPVRAAEVAELASALIEEASGE